MTAKGRPTLAWTATDAERDRALLALTRLMVLSADYISHSEIQYGLSLDGVRWAPDAADRLAGYRAWIASEPDAKVAHALDADGAVVAVAVLTWERNTPTPFATLMDIAVDPAHRGSGVGGRLLAFVEVGAATFGFGWLFLESGLRNGPAHRFFEAAGFDRVSHTFAKPLSRPSSP